MSNVLYTITMKLVKETKGALRYEETGDENKIGTLYVRKDGMGAQPWPQEIEVTVATKS